MEIDTITARTSHPRTIKSAAASVLRYDLSTLILNMKDNDDWKSGNLNSLILQNSSARKVVLTVIHNRTEVNSFQSGDSIAIQIIEGKMKFQTPLETVILGKGQILALHDKIKFTLTTLEESAFLLTILSGSLRLEEN